MKTDSTVRGYLLARSRVVKTMLPNLKKFLSKCSVKWRVTAKMIHKTWMSIREKLCVISWFKWD